MRVALEHAHAERRRVLDARERDGRRAPHRMRARHSAATSRSLSTSPLSTSTGSSRPSVAARTPTRRVERCRLGHEADLEPVRREQLDERRERGRVGADDQSDALAPAPPEPARETGEERRPAERQHRLGHALGERQQPRPASARDDQRGGRHRHRRRSPVVLRAAQRRPRRRRHAPRRRAPATAAAAGAGRAPRP
jgi:hypothetical protein